MVWEVHKCTNRGELIKMGAQCKRERETEINKLTDKILKLEVQHKPSLTTQSAIDSLETRKTLQQTLVARIQSFFLFRKKMNYEYGDEIGKFLVRALIGPWNKHNILGIKNKDGKLDVTDEQIAQHFHDFYCNLYNLPRKHKPADTQGNRPQIVQDFLNSS